MALEVGDRVMVTGLRFPEQLGAVGDIIHIADRLMEHELPIQVKLVDGPPRTPRGVLTYHDLDLTLIKKLVADPDDDDERHDPDEDVDF